MAAKKKKPTITKANIDEIISGIEVTNEKPIVWDLEAKPIDLGAALDAMVEDQRRELLQKYFDNEKTEPVVEIQYAEKIVEIVREVAVEKPVLEGFALYKKLKDERYPQGGMGEWWEDPNGTDKVYVPRPEEIYTHYLGNKQEWDELRDALVRVWIEYSLR